MSSTIDTNIHSAEDCRSPSARLVRRFCLSYEQTLDLIHSVSAAAHAAINGHPELRDQLVLETEERLAMSGCGAPHAH